MMRDSGSVQLYWSLSRGPGVGGMGGRPRGLDPVWRDVASRVADFGVIGSLLGFITVLGAGFSDGFRLRQPGQPLVAKGDFIGDDQPLRHLRLLGVLGEGEQLVDFQAQLAVAFEQTLVTDRPALGGIGVDLGSIQTDVAQGQHP